MQRWLGCVVLLGLTASVPARGEFRAGAAVVDVTPAQFPVLINGGMLSRSAQEVNTPVNARGIVLDDGRERIAIIVVDACMMSRRFLDDVKSLIKSRTGLRADRILISATHTHSAPASMGCLGTDADENYIPFLRERLVEVVVQGITNLEPAKVGWGQVDAGEFTALRRWVRRPDRVDVDPFGNATVRANMHPKSLDDVTGESGPEDPDLTMIALQTADGRPLAVLCNFSMHYFSDRAVSADYFGRFCEGFRERVAGETLDGKPPFIALLSHGCSGDIWRRDYGRVLAAKEPDVTIDDYTTRLLDLAVPAWEQIEYAAAAPLAMEEARLDMKYRVPDQQRLEWARRILEAGGGRVPVDRTEVYAREQVILDELQSTQIVVQGVRIGDVGIATTPCETYALSGLKIKARSPLARTMVIELANGGDGYIPPPEQHVLGGYNTWPARSAGLEVTAEPRIVETAVQLLEETTKQRRRMTTSSPGAASEAVLALKPSAYWRLDEMDGRRAVDAGDRGNDAMIEPGVVFWLAGPRSDLFAQPGAVNRAHHFAGGRLQAEVPKLGRNYTISAWIWNGMPRGSREVAGWFLSRGREYDAGHGEHLGLGGSGPKAGKLMYASGLGEPSVGHTEIERWTWAHVLLVREGKEVRVYLNGHAEPEIEATAPAVFPREVETLFIGGRCDRADTWEGRLDEVAVFNRALSNDEIARLTAGFDRRN